MNGETRMRVVLGENEFEIDENAECLLELIKQDQFKLNGQRGTADIILEGKQVRIHFIITENYEILNKKED
jgi:hypothetical protein